MTIWRKKPPGCHDFNLTKVRNIGANGFDYYEGWYSKSLSNAHNWHAGASGWHRLTDGSYNDFALVTSVVTGTYLAVTGKNAPDAISVNY